LTILVAPAIIAKTRLGREEFLKGTFKMKTKHVILWARRISLPATTLFAHGPAVRTVGILGLALLLGHAARAQTILGTTGDYAVMGGGAVTVTGATTITGNLGVGTGSTTDYVTFGSTGALVSITTQNTTDFNRAFTGLENMTPTVNLNGQTLGTTVGTTGAPLLPGVYEFTDPETMTGNLVLNANNQSNAVWVFQMAGTFNTTAGTSVTIINPVGDSVANYGLFWQVSGATVFGANTSFEGNLLDGSTIGFGADVTINNGRALTATGTIGLATGDAINFIAANSGYSGGLAFVGDTDTITAVPEPASTSLLFAGFSALVIGVRRIRRHYSDRKLAI
jgi:type VI secretion system secreted protein VgrG